MIRPPVVNWTPNDLPNASSLRPGLQASSSTQGEILSQFYAHRRGTGGVSAVALGEESVYNSEARSHYLHDRDCLPI